VNDSVKGKAEGNEGKVPRIRRRRSRRHRRNRLIRRWLTAATVALCVITASAFALKYLSPSFFQAKQSLPPTFAQTELSRDRLLTLNQMVAEVAPPVDRPVYPYSVVAGGVEDAKELKWVAEHDPIVAAHYAGFDYDHARVVRLALAQTAYVSYRIGNRIYWMHHRVTLHKGEKVITDGRITARARCANRIENGPQHAVAPAVEPPAVAFDQPIHMPSGTAMQAPSVPFQSALLSRPALIGGGGPLSLYDPIGSGGLMTIYPPPLPSGLCGPNKKKGTSESGCCPGEAGTGKKKGSGCGATGVVPEPGTWILFASGLAAIYWQARGKVVPA
jgi:hypothetical protein